MRIHCLGVGSIGSFLASALSTLPGTRLRLLVRRKDVAGDLVRTSPGSSPQRPLCSINIEQAGVVSTYGDLEVEAIPSDRDKLATGRRDILAQYPGLVQHDRIDTLIVTTKAQQTFAAIQPLLHRLDHRSTVVLCQNGLGVTEGLMQRFWPQDETIALAARHRSPLEDGYSSVTPRPNLVCATTSHGVWRKNVNTFVHAGAGDLKFGVLANEATLQSIASYSPHSPWGEHYNNPVLNTQATNEPRLEHIPPTDQTMSLRNTVNALMRCQETLNTRWLALPTLSLAQYQKIAANASVNTLTAVLGVHNGAMVGSAFAKETVMAIADECSRVFAAHLAFEDEPDRDPKHDILPFPDSHPLAAASLTEYTFEVMYKTAANLSSTLQDMLSTPFPPGSPGPHGPSSTEVDFLNGYIERLGKKYHIQTPTVSAMGHLVKLKEQMIRCGAVDRVLEARTEQIVHKKIRLPKWRRVEAPEDTQSADIPLGTFTEVDDANLTTIKSPVLEKRSAILQNRRENILRHQESGADASLSPRKTLVPGEGKLHRKLDRTH